MEINNRDSRMTFLTVFSAAMPLSSPGMFCAPGASCLNHLYHWSSILASALTRARDIFCRVTYCYDPLRVVMVCVCQLVERQRVAS